MLMHSLTFCCEGLNALYTPIATIVETSHKATAAALWPDLLGAGTCSLMLVAPARGELQVSMASGLDIG
jgi:hypothetical protein